MGMPQRTADFFSKNVVVLEERNGHKARISLRSLLGIDDDDMSSLEIEIIDDLPIKITFKNNFNINSLKNMVFSTVKKLFLNPKDLITKKPLDFRYTHLHSNRIDALMAKPKHVAFKKRIKLKNRKGCACSKCS